MKNLNKVLAMLVVFMMMLSTAAFASSFSDVADESSYSTAIEVVPYVPKIILNRTTNHNRSTFGISGGFYENTVNWRAF